MSRSQGFYGALDQYWDIEPKARLHRRNTFFEDFAITSNRDVFVIGLTVSAVVLAAAMFWQLVGVIL